MDIGFKITINTQSKCFYIDNLCSEDTGARVQICLLYTHHYRDIIIGIQRDISEHSGSYLG